MKTTIKKQVLSILPTAVAAGIALVAATAAEHSQAVPMPDLAIGNTSSAQKGDNIYNTTGAGQTVSRQSRNRRTVKFFIDAEEDDDGVMGSRYFTWFGSKSNRYFRVRYYNRTSGINLTSKMIKGMTIWQANCLSLPCPDPVLYNHQICAEVKPKRKGQMRRKTNRMRVWTTVSQSVDAVRANTRAR